MLKKSELYTITKARDLLGYILTITIKSPKNLRYTYVNKIHEFSIDALMLLIEANEHQLSVQNFEKRRDLQFKAKIKFKMLGYFAFLGCEAGAILQKQYNQISLQIEECIKMLTNWIKSDQKKREVNISF